MPFGLTQLGQLVWADRANNGRKFVAGIFISFHIEVAVLVYRGFPRSRRMLFMLRFAHRSPFPASKAALILSANPSNASALTGDLSEYGRSNRNSLTSSCSAGFSGSGSGPRRRHLPRGQPLHLLRAAICSAVKMYSFAFSHVPGSSGGAERK